MNFLDKYSSTTFHVKYHENPSSGEQADTNEEKNGTVDMILTHSSRDLGECAIK